MKKVITQNGPVRGEFLSVRIAATNVSYNLRVNQYDQFEVIIFL